MIRQRPSRNCKRPVRLIEVLEADTSDNEQTSPKRRFRIPLTNVIPVPQQSRIQDTKLSPVDVNHASSPPPAPPPNSRTDDASLPISFVADMLETLLIKLDESMAKQQELDRKLTILLCRSRPDMPMESKQVSASQPVQSPTVTTAPVVRSVAPAPAPAKPTAHVPAVPQKRGRFTGPNIEFPLKLVTEFDQLEYELTNETSFNRLLERLNSIGGNSVERLVKNVLEHMFMYPLTLHINWTGLNNKKALQHSNTFELICRVCTKQKGDEDSVRRIVEHHVRTWFRTALERERNRLKRSVHPRVNGQDIDAKASEYSQGSSAAPRKSYSSSTHNS